MRIHTTAVPATKYLPERIHVKLTDDNNVPNNIKDHTYQVDEYTDVEHDWVAARFLNDVIGKGHAHLNRIGMTLTERGYVYEVVESV
jgi:hypothetical protein